MPPYDTLSECARRGVSAAAVVAAAACSAPQAGAATRIPEQSATARFKAALLPLVASTYGGSCVAMGPKGLGLAAPVAVDRSGRITAGPRSDDVVQEASEIVLTLERGKPLLSFMVEMLGPEEHNDNGYNVSYTGGDTPGVVAGASGGKVDAADVCTGGPHPPGVGADLWRIAATFVKVTDNDVLCIDSRKDQRGGPVMFSGTAFTIGDYTLPATAPRRAETIVATDKSGGGFSYSVTDSAGNVASVTIRADDSFTGALLHRSDDSMLSCGPRSR